MIKHPKISVIISAYNDRDLMEVLLRKLYQTKCRDFEAVVVDDASQEDLSELRKLFPIRYYRNKKNLGAAKTRNIAAEKARGEILLSLDNDVKPLDDLIWEIEQFFKKNPHVVAVTGFPGTGAENPSFFAKYKFLRDWSFWHSEIDHFRFCYFRPAIGAIRRDLFLELGGYDSRYCRPGVPAVEDLEFSYRLALKGKIVFNPKIVVGHPFGGFKNLVRTYFKRTAIYLEILKEKRLFSGVATTKAEAVTVLLAPICFLLIPLAIWYRPLWFLLTVFFLGFIFRQRKFLSLCWQKEGFLFTLAVFWANWFLYLVINLGAIYALFFLVPQEFLARFKKITR